MRWKCIIHKNAGAGFLRSRASPNRSSPRAALAAKDKSTPTEQTEKSRGSNADLRVQLSSFSIDFRRSVFLRAVGKPSELKRLPRLL